MNGTTREVRIKIEIIQKLGIVPMKDNMKENPFKYFYHV